MSGLREAMTEAMSRRDDPTGACCAVARNHAQNEVEAERARIVKWLRASKWTGGLILKTVRRVADAIERGEHNR